jgi:WD40 repeat protein
VPLAAAQSVPQELAVRAVSLEFLQQFYDACVAPLPGGAAMSTEAVVTRLIMPATHALGRCSVARAAPSACGAPLAFVSHAFRNPLSLLLAALRDHFRDALPEDVYVWLDIFAINQHNPGADLHDGKTLACTIAAAHAVLVILDTHATPLTRLWCLFEIDSTPPDKLLLLTPGATDTDLSAAFAAISVELADCYDGAAKKMILGKIQESHGGTAAFQAALRLRLLLRPTSYAADVAALLARAAGDAWRFEELHAFLLLSAPPLRAADAGGETADADAAPRLACVAGGAGEGKSTLAAALCGRSEVHAHHFCKASDVRRQDTGAVVRSLAFQLALALRGAFAARLLALTPTQLASMAASPDAAYELLLAAPLAALPPGTPVVLLFDALDEAETHKDSSASLVISPMMKLLLRLGRLPRGGASLRVVVTTRRDEDAKARIITPLRSCFRACVRLFEPAELRIAAPAPPLMPLMPPGAADVALTPLLRTLNAALRMAHPQHAADATTLDGAYTAWFTAAAVAGTLPPPVAALLRVLVAARQPPSVAQLAAMGLRDAMATLPGWRTLFLEREHKLHMLHRSIAEWLTRDAAGSGGALRFGFGAPALREGHVAWAAHLWDAQLAPWLFCDAGSGVAAEAPPQGSYVYAHALAHLDAAGRARDATRVLLSLRWLQATLRERGLGALLTDLATRRETYGAAVAVLHSALRLAAPGLQHADAPACLPAQLAGRLRGAALEGDSADVALLRGLAGEARAWRGDAPWLCAVGGTLRAPGDALETIIKTGLTRYVASIVALSAQRVVSTQDGGTELHVWNLTTGERELTLCGHTESIVDVAVLPPPDGRIVSGARDGTVRLWSAATGECERVVSGYFVALLPDGHILCETVVERRGAQPTPFMWHAHTGELVDEQHTLSRYGAAVLKPLQAAPADAITRAGHALVHIRDGDAPALRVEDVLSGEAVLTIPLGDAADSLKTFVVQRDGRDEYAVAGFWDARVRVWSLTTGTLLHTLVGHTGCVAVVTPLPDGRIITGGGLHDHSLRLWDLQSGKCELVLECHTTAVDCIALLQDGRAVSGAGDGTMCVLDVRARDRSEHPHSVGHSQYVTCMAVLSDGCHVVTGSKDCTLCVWDMTTGRCTCTLRGHTHVVTCVAALPDGRCVSGSLDDTLRLWSAHDAACDATLAGHTHHVWCVCALPDGRVVSGSQDGTVRVWGAAAPHECEHVFTTYVTDYNGELQPESVSAVGVLPGNRIVAANLHMYNPLWVWSIDAAGARDERTIALPKESCLRRRLPDAKIVYNLKRLGMTAHEWNPAGGTWAAALLAAASADISPEEAAFMDAFAAFARPLPPGVDRGALEARVARTHMDLEAREFAVSADGGHVAVVTHGTTVHFFELMPAAERACVN